MLYFLPNTVAISKTTLSEFGLQRVVTKVTSRQVMRGPGGKSGLLVCQSDTIPTLRFTDRQTWQPRFGSEAWIGIDPDSPPTPHSLSRETQLSGKKLRLFDGQTYLIPQLRAFDAEQLDGPLVYACNLDQILTQDPESGRLLPSDVVPQYADIWNKGLSIGDRLLAQLNRSDAAHLENVELDTFAIEVLGLNYRVEAPEISLAKLFSVELSTRVMQIAIDWETLRANLGNRLRRRVSGGISTESGPTPPTVD
jgi:hypothetical protein